MRIEKNLSKTLQRLMASSKESMGTLLGAWKSAIIGQGLEVKEIRPFTAGDNPLGAVWSRFAQTGMLYSKLFQEERDRTIYLALDRSGSMFQEKGKAAAFSEELFSYLAWAASASNDKVGAIFGRKNSIQVLKPRSGRFQAELLIQEALQPIELPSSSSLARFFQQEGRKGLKKSLLFYISDFLEPSIDWKALFFQLSRRHEVILLRIQDSSIEEQIASSYGLPTFDPEKEPFSSHLLTLNMVKERKKNNQVEQKRVQEAAFKSNLFFFPMEASQECLPQLIRLLEKKRGEQR